MVRRSSVINLSTYLATDGHRKLPVPVCMFPHHRQLTFPRCIPSWSGSTRLPSSILWLFVTTTPAYTLSTKISIWRVVLLCGSMSPAYYPGISSIMSAMPLTRLGLWPPPWMGQELARPSIANPWPVTHVTASAQVTLDVALPAHAICIPYIAGYIPAQSNNAMGMAKGGHTTCADQSQDIID